MADIARPLGASEASAVSYARYYTLALLTLVYALNFLDRTIFNVLIEPIKKEFQLTDTMLGLLAGFGFVLMYSALGMPIARLADRRSRRNIVAAGLAFWSAMTAFEDFVMEKVLEGRPIRGLYPPTDPQTNADFAVWRKARGR